MFAVNTPPDDLAASRTLPPGFAEQYQKLHAAFFSRQQALMAQRATVLEQAHQGRQPDHLPASLATTGNWKIKLPEWCQDQRNQMTGPADDAELVVKMLNSGAPGVMLDLEDSMANSWSNHVRGVDNILKALTGELSYFDKKRDRTVTIQPSTTVILTRVRGLHLHQAGIVAEGLTSASLFDVALLSQRVDPSKLKHPLTLYIPKSESAEEALWWKDVLQAVATQRGWAKDYIKCMALVEAHPLAYQIEEFIYHLRDHLIGLNLGRWDYMASLIDFNLNDPRWVLPDRNTIPHDVAFFQRLRELIPELCHKRGILAIGGMTALYPSREDPALNARALAVLEQDKKNEASCLMDGAWTGHPDQNEIAVKQFPAPNQLRARPANPTRYPDLRPAPEGVGQRTLNGTRAAVRTTIRYRQGVLAGRGASLLDGYMEDLATDRIYRIMIAQRLRHSETVAIVDENGRQVVHSRALISQLYDEELKRLLVSLPPATPGETAEQLKQARAQSEAMVHSAKFDPI